MTQAEFSAWPGLDEVVSCDEGASPRKYREMSTLGAAVSTKRPCCIAAKVEHAASAGVSWEEISESALLPGVLQAATHSGS